MADRVKTTSQEFPNRLPPQDIDAEASILSAILIDNEQMLLLMEREEGADGKPFAIWTNYNTLLKSYTMLFEMIWKEPHDISVTADAPPVS